LSPNLKEQWLIRGLFFTKASPLLCMLLNCQVGRWSQCLVRWWLRTKQARILSSFHFHPSTAELIHASKLIVLGLHAVKKRKWCAFGIRLYGSRIESNIVNQHIRTRAGGHFGRINIPKEDCIILNGCCNLRLYLYVPNVTT
jgi:hypothetical protein